MKTRQILTSLLCSLLFLLPLYSIAATSSEFHNTIQDFRPEIIDFRADGLPGCFRDGVLVQPNPTDLSVGDIFIDVDGIARKVVKTEWIGTDFYIDTEKPEFEEVYVYAEIPHQTVSLQTGSMDSNSRGIVDISFEQEIYNKDASSIKIVASGQLDSTMTVGFKAPSCVQFKIRSWKFWEWTVGFRYERGYVEAAIDYDLDLTGAVNCSVSKTLETKPVTLYGFGSPFPGIAANLGLMGKASIEGQLAFDLPFTLNINGDALVKCTLDGQVPYMIPTDASGTGTMNYSVSLDPSVSADASLKLKCYLGTSLTLVGIEIADFEAGGGPYLKVNGTLAGSIGYDSVTGMTGPSWSASASSEIGVCTEISGSICNDKWKITMFSREFPIYKFFDIGTPEEEE